MKPSDRFKTCAHCDGRIPVEVVICPYCSSSLSSLDGGPRVYSANKNSTENLANLYNPPYASRENSTTPAEEKKQEVPLGRVQAKAATLDKSNHAEKSELLPVSLLVIGSNLLLIGLMQLFFSEEGILSLEWNASFWYIYSLIALPLLAFGVKLLKGNTK